MPGEEPDGACHAALEELTRERVPLDSAGTQMNLALALATIAYRTGQSRAPALAAVDAALVVFREVGADRYLRGAEEIRAWIARG